MNMLCLGWRTITTCGGAEGYGRNQQIIPPVGDACSGSATWFYVGLAIVAGLALAKK